MHTHVLIENKQFLLLINIPIQYRSCQITIHQVLTLDAPHGIHKHGLPHNLCQYPCPYGGNDTVSYMDSLDISDISDYEDYMVTSSDEEVPGMAEVPY